MVDSGELHSIPFTSIQFHPVHLNAPITDHKSSSSGVPINVNAIAQCKIDKARVSTAAEMFLGKDLDYIKSVVLQTIEGHLRAITGTLTMEEIYLERQTYATLVTEMASKDLENFGIALLSFTIKEITDKVDYLTSMGRKDIAKTQHKAAVDVATVQKDCKIKESDAELAKKEVEFKNNKELEEQNKLLQTEIEKQSCEVNKKQTEARMAYNLEAAKIKQQITKERKNVELEEAQLKLTILENEKKQKQIDYHCDIVLPAQIEAYRIEKLAEAEKYKKMELARANAEKMKKIADAESEVIRSKGKAQVELLKNKAAAFKSYNDAAVLQITLAALPKITAELCQPLERIEEIVLVNGPPGGQPGSLSQNFSGDAMRLASELPPTIKALTGLNLTKALDNVINILPASNSLSMPTGGQFEQQKSPKSLSLTNGSSKKSVINHHHTIDTVSLMNNPQTIKSSKASSSSSGSVSNLSKVSKQSLLNTKPKSVSNLSIHTVK